MKFVKEHLEVVTCYIPSTTDVIYEGTDEERFELTPNKDHFPSNTCFNVFWFNQTSWSAPICRYVSEYYDTLKALSCAKAGSKAVVRLCAIDNESKRLVSGSGFYMLPNMVITNCHVDEKISSNHCIAYSNAWSDISNFSDAIAKIDVLPKRLNLHYSGRSHQQTPFPSKFVQAKQWKGLDIITGQTGDFGFFDFSANGYSGEGNTVLFIPSPTILQPGDEIITLSYPGDEDTTSPLKDHANYAKWAPSDSFLKKNIFNGYGTLCASFGKILHPFKVNNDVWEKDEEFQYDSVNQECLASSECLIFGSSGGVMISKSCQVHQVNNYTLVEFHAIHVGGEFVRCSDCLREQILALNDKGVHIAEPGEWRICDKCINDQEEFYNPMSYSNSISVHSKPFVEFFKFVILPKLKPLINSISDIPSLEMYCQNHNL